MPNYELKPRRYFRGGCVIGLIIVLIIAIPAWWFCVRTSPLEISKETTYFLGPERMDGKGIDYFLAIEKEFASPEMKTDENGYRLIVRACGDMAEREKYVFNKKTGMFDTVKLDPEPFRLQVYEKLGLDPDEPPRLKIESPYTVLSRYDEIHVVAPPLEETGRKYSKLCSRGFWTIEELPELREWLEKCDPGLDLIGEAVRKPVFRIPMVRETENTSFIYYSSEPEARLMRELARAVHGRAYYRIGTGDIEGAIYDIFTILHLGRHLQSAPNSLFHLVGIAIEGIGLAIGIGGNSEYPPSREQLERFLSELEKLPPPVTFENYFNLERFYALDAFQETYYGRIQSENLNPDLASPFFVRWGSDINVLMKRINRIYDSLIERNFSEDDLDTTWKATRLIFPETRSEMVCDSTISANFPGFKSIREAMSRPKCAMNMMKLNLALLLYEKDHGKMPEGDWRTAVRPYLGDDPDRYFRCPSHHLEPDETSYAMIGNIENKSPGPNQVLLVEVFQAQKFGEGEGRFPKDKIQMWTGRGSIPDDFEGLGSYHSGGLNMSTRGGCVRFLSTTIDPEFLEELMEGTADRLP